MSYHISLFLLFFFNDTATTEIYTLSLHDALPILADDALRNRGGLGGCRGRFDGREHVCLLSRNMPARERRRDRKSTRLNSSHTVISYAVFCLKKKKKKSYK